MSVSHLPQKNIASIIKSGTDEYVTLLDTTIYKENQFRREINRQVMAEMLNSRFVPAYMLNDLQKISSASTNSHLLPMNMLHKIESLRGNKLTETAYHTIRGYIFCRLQEHELAYQIIKLAIVAKSLHEYNNAKLEDLYTEARKDETSNLATRINSAELTANITIARNCVLVRNYFNKSNLK